MEIEATGKGKSAYKGVYMCGKRWKAQIQIRGTQFYLGTFDTEQEAAMAYETKARAVRKAKESGLDEQSPSASPLVNARSSPVEERPSKRSKRGYQSSVALKPEEEIVMMQSIAPGLLNGGGLPPMMHPVSINQFSMPVGSFNDASSSHFDDDFDQAEDGIDGVEAADIESFPSSTPNVLNDLWGRYVQVSQRLIIAQSAAESLGKLQLQHPDKEQATLLNNLQGEQLMLGVIREHLQRAISRVIDPVESLRRIQPQQPQTSQIASRVKYYNSMDSDINGSGNGSGNQNGSDATSHSQSRFSNNGTPTAIESVADMKITATTTTTTTNKSNGGDNSPLHLLCGAAVAVAAARERNSSPQALVAEAGLTDVIVDMQTVSDIPESSSTSGQISGQSEGARSDSISDVGVEVA